MIGPDRRRQDRDRAPPGAARRRAVHQGRGDQVHRGRLRRARRRHDRARPGRDQRQADARAGDAQGAHARRRTRPRSGSSTCCCRRRAIGSTTRGRRDSRRARSSARSCARASSTTRRSRSRSPASQPQMEILAPPGMEELTTQIQGMFQNLGGGRRRAAEAEDPRGDEARSPTRRPARLVNDEELKTRALANVEQNGIVFLDEIDKITSRSRAAGRRRLAPGRAARPAAAGRGHDGLDELRHGEDRPHPVHRARARSTSPSPPT